MIKTLMRFYAKIFNRVSLIKNIFLGKVIYFKKNSTSHKLCRIIYTELYLLFVLIKYNIIIVNSIRYTFCIHRTIDEQKIKQNSES